MKVAEIRKYETAKLTKEVVKIREEITEARRRMQMGETKNVRVIRAKRKDLARMLTVLGEQLSESLNKTEGPK